MGVRGQGKIECFVPMGRLFHTILELLEMIKIGHSVLALPFAFMGAVLAARGLPDGRTLFFILLAMLGARSAAMAFNRLADAKIDAANPRKGGQFRLIEEKKHDGSLPIVGVNTFLPAKRDDAEIRRLELIRSTEQEKQDQVAVIDFDECAECGVCLRSAKCPASPVLKCTESIRYSR